MRWAFRPSPDDQQRPLQVGAQRLEELDVLLLLDRALVQTKHAVRAAQSGDDGDVGPVEVELNDRRLALRRPGAHPCGPLARAGLVDEDDQSPIALGLFLGSSALFVGEDGGLQMVVENATIWGGHRPLLRAPWKQSQTAAFQDDAINLGQPAIAEATRSCVADRQDR
jgi:hypothetical protein